MSKKPRGYPFHIIGVAVLVSITALLFGIKTAVTVMLILLLLLLISAVLN